jgi:hypothetical protein
MAREVSKVIEQARNPKEAWRLLESHFDKQTAIIDDLMSQLLSTERVVNDTQTLAHYNRVLRAIREAKELERLQDFLTPNRMEMLLEVLPKKEINYWRLEQLGVATEDMSVAFYVFARRRAQELCSNATAAKIAQDARPAPGLGWEGSCVLGDLCGESHAPEECRLASSKLRKSIPGGSATHTYIHSITFIQYIYPSPFAGASLHLLIA